MGFGLSAVCSILRPFRGEGHVVARGWMKVSREMILYAYVSPERPYS